MAQYTAALAEEYNAMQREVAKILGPASGVPKSYGAYNVDGFRQSSQVAVGQLIKPAEWENLRTDLNTILWYTNDSRTGITNPVQNNVINWSDVVAYQNVYNNAYNLAINHTYYDDGSFGGDNLTSKVRYATKNPGDWGGPASGAGADGIAWQGAYVQWSSFDELNAFFNLGGYIYTSLSGYGGTVDTSGTKDYAIKHVCSAASSTYGFTQWWNNGGSSKTAGYYTTISSTYGDSGYNPYSSGSKYVSAYTQVYYDGDRTIYLYARVQDYAIGTTSDGVTAEPSPTLTIDGTATARYPTGSNPGGGVEAGYIINKTDPDMGTPSWSVYDA